MPLQPPERIICIICKHYFAIEMYRQNVCFVVSSCTQPQFNPDVHLLRLCCMYPVAGTCEQPQHRSSNSTTTSSRHSRALGRHAAGGCTHACLQ
jgi:hypothetical protein